MTTTERPPPCDCPEQPCVCSQEGYAAGQYRALENFISSIKNEPRHAKSCCCAICYMRKGWDEIQKTGADPETITRKMREFSKGLQKFSE